MGRLMAMACAIIAATLLFASAASAWTPPGQRGYEGRPGNQGVQNSH